MRKEIELAYDATRAVLQRADIGTAEFYEGEANGLLRALALLDQWELVAEDYEVSLGDMMETGVALIPVWHLKPGDIISVYKKEASDVSEQRTDRVVR